MTAATKESHSWVTQLLLDKGLSQRKAAELCGMEPSKLNKVLTGNRRLQIPEAETLANLLGVAPMDLMRQLGGASPRARDSEISIPVRAAVNADCTLEFRAGLGVAPAPMMDPPAGMIAARVTATDSLLFGWTYFWTPRNSVSADAIGKMAVVDPAGEGKPMLRVVRPGSIGGTWTLIRANGEITAEDVRLASATPVRAIRT